MASSHYGLYISSRHSRVEVLNSSKSTVLYSVEVQPSMPQLYIFRPSTKMPCDQLIAIATFRRFFSNVDIQMGNDEHLKLQRKNVLSSIHIFNVAGFEWGWRRDGVITGDLKLINVASNQTIATFHQACSSSRKMLGIFVVFGTHQTQIIDAIIVTGLVKLGYPRLVQSVVCGA
jgi:hypothetical protein